MITLKTPPAATALTSLAVVKAELGLTTTTEDAWLTDAIASQSAALSGHCRRIFGRATYVEQFRSLSLIHI